ncbi:hypothetical protein C0214_27180 (plasmid) [Methylobacterium sp. DM1]|nr:hypothetical protein C0214_27180 [Methylobacterium sp. DM1]
MTIEPTEFDMIALARRGLHAHLDEVIAEIKMARAHELWDRRTGQMTPESEEAKAKAWGNWCEAARTLDLFNLLHPEPVAACATPLPTRRPGPRGRRPVPAGDPDASRFARGIAAYARCQNACRDRTVGEPECWDSCRRAEAAMRRKG